MENFGNVSFGNVNGNGMDNNKVEKIMEEKKMKNNFRENRKAELEVKAAAAAKAAREAELAAIKPINIVETMDEVANKEACTYRSEEGYSMGTNGGLLKQIPVQTKDGELTTVAAVTIEEAEQVKADVEQNGRQGDGLFHKLVWIGGIPCDCCGRTIEELEADIRAAENYYQKHIKGSVLRDIDVAEQLVDAGYAQSDLEQIKGSDGGDYLITYSEKRVMDTAGNTMADLDNLKSKLEPEDVKTLLEEKLEQEIAEREAAAAEYDDYDEDWDDEEDDYYEEPDDDCDEDDDEDGSSMLILF